MEGLQTIIEMRCCVCGRFLGIKDGRGVSGVSHGFCDGCFKEFWKKIVEERKLEKGRRRTYRKSDRGGNGGLRRTGP